MGMPDALVQVVHQSDKVSGSASYVANGVQAIAGLQAFRNYNWMEQVVGGWGAMRGFNAAGNFRGMVVSSRWATTYQVISPYANAIGNVATVAAIAGNAVDMAPQFEAVYASSDSPTIKGLKYTSLAGTVAQKTLAGIVTSGVHLIYLPLVFSCGRVARANEGSGIGTAASVCSQVFQDADTLVQTSASYVTDPVNQQRWLQTVVNIFLPQTVN
jgi:hypothetical protein